jgi:Kef-type K+ transport system membrane component KefB
VDILTVLFYLILFGCVVWLAAWIIEKYLPEPAKTPAKAICGILFLIILLGWFFHTSGIEVPTLRR